MKCVYLSVLHHAMTTPSTTTLSTLTEKRFTCNESLSRHYHLVVNVVTTPNGPVNKMCVLLDNNHNVTIDLLNHQICFYIWSKIRLT